MPRQHADNTHTHVYIQYRDTCMYMCTLRGNRQTHKHVPTMQKEEEEKEHIICRTMTGILSHYAEELLHVAFLTGRNAVHHNTHTHTLVHTHTHTHKRETRID